MADDEIPATVQEAFAIAMFAFDALMRELRRPLPAEVLDACTDGVTHFVAGIQRMSPALLGELTCNEVLRRAVRRQRPVVLGLSPKTHTQRPSAN